MKNCYTITLSWETQALRKSNLDWILIHFESRFGKDIRPIFSTRGRKVKFTTGYGSKYRMLKRLASQCGATVLEKTINGIDTKMVKVTIQ